MKTTARSAIRPLAAALALTAAVTLAACSGTPTTDSTSGAGAGGGSSAAAEGLKIGFSPFTLQAPALKGLADALTAVAGSQGDSVVTADANNDPSTQLQQLQQWIQLDQVDAIWVIPADGKAIASALTQAQAKGIVIIASGVPADYGFDGPQAGITFTVADNEAYGGKLGELAAQCITEKLDGVGNVIFLTSPQGAQSSEAINTAFRDALAKGAPDSKIVNEQDAGDRLTSQQTVSSALQGAPDANVMVGTDDESTLGGLAAFTQAGKAADATCVLGAGGNDEAQAAVKSGELYSEVAFDFQADLGQNLAELHKLAADPTADGSQLTIPLNVVTQ
ncbi:sugar ABC transporter substrate-binding protein [Naasia lichenicola]|uniref:Sugar ABC transporter substrate-binding protein n=1 Tax=Naasia lichenicola TaxID=2565933 RepID=A0A4S4FQF5_9MICO|nr:sugar ABC transporter substrate-binding protein [Naasia lichenicola]THG31616.1 sugar ABC transporter substrate-binding protein [Naasia lichenicola]